MLGMVYWCFDWVVPCPGWARSIFGRAEVCVGGSDCPCKLRGDVSYGSVRGGNGDCTDCLKGAIERFIVVCSLVPVGGEGEHGVEWCVQGKRVPGR